MIRTREKISHKLCICTCLAANQRSQLDAAVAHRLAGMAHVLGAVEVLEGQTCQEVSGMHQAGHGPHPPPSGALQHIGNVLELGDGIRPECGRQGVGGGSRGSLHQQSSLQTERCQLSATHRTSCWYQALATSPRSSRIFSALLFPETVSLTAHPSFTEYCGNANLGKATGQREKLPPT